MKRKPRITRQPTIWLIPEDETGYHVFQAIVRAKKLNPNVEWLGQTAGISTLANELEGLVKTLLRRIDPSDCIVVLHDTDETVETYREKHEKIARICDKYQDRVTRLWAVQEIEAWLLADEALCKWLDTTPRSFDGKAKPSEALERLVNRKLKKHWTRETKPKVIAHMDATGIRLSESMRLAVDTLLHLPCTQQASPA